MFTIRKIKKAGTKQKAIKIRYDDSDSIQYQNDWSSNDPALTGCNNVVLPKKL